MHEYGHHPPLKYRITFKLNFTKNVILFQKNTSSESANEEGGKMAAPIYSKVSLFIHFAAPPVLFAGSQLPSDHLHVCNRHLSVLSALFNNLLLRGLFRLVCLFHCFSQSSSFSWILRMYSSWSDGIQLQCPSCFLLCCYWYTWARRGVRRSRSRDRCSWRRRSRPEVPAIPQSIRGRRAE